MESNHHGCFHPQGPQPCASTSSATAARGRTILDVGVREAVAACGRPQEPVACEQVFERFATRGNPARREEDDVDLDLTKRQKEIFDFIGKYAAKTGYPPTVREIGKAVGLHSSSTVHAHLANLEKIGLLRRDPSKPRAIELLFDKRQADDPARQRAAAGRPGRRRRADPRRGEHRGVHRGPRRDRRRGRRLHPPRPRRKHEGRRASSKATTSSCVPPTMPPTAKSSSP